MPADKDIAEYLEDLTHGTVGTDIWVGFMPDSPDDSIVVTQTAGKPPEPNVNQEYPNVQVRVRNVSYSTGWTLVNDIYDDLHGTNRQTIEGRLYEWIGALGAPTFLGRDENDRSLFVINFEVIKAIE